MLITTLPLTVFEQLAEDRNSRKSFSSGLHGIQSHNSNLLLWSKDPRIKLGLFLHPSISKFNVDGKGNELMLMQQQDDFGGPFVGGLDEFFWCAQLTSLVNLVHLNLNLITTDEILLLVGSSCPKLEVVNIVSRIKQDTVHTYNNEGQGQGPYPTAQFPGITLKFCVSDVGLNSLLKCQNLRRVTMNKIINHSPANRGITLKGVRRLVQGLPLLEYINFGSIGKILSECEEKLKLTHFSELDPAFVDVKRLQRLCPLIGHVSLSVPITINSSGNIDANVAPCVAILEALAESELKLKVLDLQHFPFGDAFKKLLKAKGQRLQELHFRAITTLNSEHLVFIGENCPRLQWLHIKEVGPEPSTSSANFVGINSTALKRQNMFTELQTLQVSGRAWHPNIVLPILLTSAHKLTKLSLLNMTQRMAMDQALNRVMQSNKLSKVATISLYSGCFLSMDLVRRLTFLCPKLTVFSFIQSENVDLAEVERLRLEVSAKNLNIKLCCLEMFDV